MMWHYDQYYMPQEMSLSSSSYYSNSDFTNRHQLNPLYPSVINFGVGPLNGMCSYDFVGRYYPSVDLMNHPGNGHIYNGHPYWPAAPFLIPSFQMGNGHSPFNRNGQFCAASSQANSSASQNELTNPSTFPIAAYNLSNGLVYNEQPEQISSPDATSPCDNHTSISIPSCQVGNGHSSNSRNGQFGAASPKANSLASGRIQSSQNEKAQPLSFPIPLYNLDNGLVCNEQPEQISSPDATSPCDNHTSILIPSCQVGNGHSSNSRNGQFDAASPKANSLASGRIQSSQNEMAQPLSFPIPVYNLDNGLVCNEQPEQFSSPDATFPCDPEANSSVDKTFRLSQDEPWKSPVLSITSFERSTDLMNHPGNGHIYNGHPYWPAAPFLIPSFQMGNGHSPFNRNGQFCAASSQANSSASQNELTNPSTFPIAAYNLSNGLVYNEQPEQISSPDATSPCDNHTSISIPSCQVGNGHSSNSRNGQFGAASPKANSLASGRIQSSQNEKAQPLSFPIPLYNLDNGLVCNEQPEQISSPDATSPCDNHTSILIPSCQVGNGHSSNSRNGQFDAASPKANSLASGRIQSSQNEMAQPLSFPIPVYNLDNGLVCNEQPEQFSSPDATFPCDPEANSSVDKTFRLSQDEPWKSPVLSITSFERSTGSIVDPVLNETAASTDLSKKSQRPVLTESVTIKPKYTVGCDNSAMHTQTSDQPSKKLCCPFCDKLYVKLARHMETKHSEEPDVAKFLSFSKGSKERRIIQDSLRKTGMLNWDMNAELNGGLLITSRRPNSIYSTDASRFIACPYCFGMYAKTALRLHVTYRCPKSENRKDEKAKGERVTTALGTSLEARHLGTLLEARHLETASKALVKVFKRFHDDVVTRSVKFDWMLIVYGNKLAAKYTRPKSPMMIRNRLRLVGRILLELKQIQPEITNFAELYYPKHFDHVIEAIRVISRFDATRNEFGAPATASSSVTEIRRIGIMLISEYIRRDDQEKQRITQNFLTLMDSDVHIMISKAVTETQSKMKRQKVVNLPSIDDLKIFAEYLESESSRHFTELSQSFDYDTWLGLSKLTIASIIVFNRKRVGDTENITLAEFNCRDKNETTNEHLFGALSERSKEVAKRYSRLNVRGKKNRTVSVLLNADMEKWIDLLIAHRIDAKISPENEYLFALPSPDDEVKLINACTTLKTFSKACDAKNPSSLTGTNMRKQVATFCSALQMPDADVSNVADFMGHEELVHRQIYQQNTAHRTDKVSRLLEAAQGKVPIDVVDAPDVGPDVRAITKPLDDREKIRAVAKRKKASDDQTKGQAVVKRKKPSDDQISRAVVKHIKPPADQTNVAIAIRKRKQASDDRIEVAKSSNDRTKVAAAIRKRKRPSDDRNEVTAANRKRNKQSYD